MSNEECGEYFPITRNMFVREWRNRWDHIAVVKEHSGVNHSSTLRHDSQSEWHVKTVGVHSFVSCPLQKLFLLLWNYPEYTSYHDLVLRWILSGTNSDAMGIMYFLYWDKCSDLPYNTFPIMLTIVQERVRTIFCLFHASVILFTIRWKWQCL